ncbi:MAG: zinc-dependent alcohol dehydrogenase family protein [Chloroflexi bacterium]|nr:zinc-dependent alcohol dehydrogenase family protein [Chloroflexota bacterium]
MRAVVYTAPREFSIRTVPRPEPGPGELVLRTTITGVCGTDLHIHDGGFFSAYPLIPGHEIVGAVEAVGPGAEDVPIGRQVAADNTVLCGHCYFCRRDEPLFCRNFYSLGVNGPGGFAEYVLVRAEKCFPADDLAAEVAVMTEPTACAMHGMDVLDLRPGSDVLLFGAGPTGLVLAQLILHGGAARVTVAAPTAFKLELARSYGVDETVLIRRDDLATGLTRLRELAPLGFDVVVDATGAPSVIEQCVSLTKDGGTVLVYGMADEADRVSWSPYEIFRRQLTIKGSFAQTHCFDRALAVLRSSRVRTEGILSHCFTLEEYGAALEALRSDRSCLKAAIVPARSDP